MFPQFLIILAACSLCVAEDVFTCLENPTPISELINSLGVDITNRIKEDNFFISPFSISVALAMVYLGTRADTKDQMTASLNYDILGQNCLDTKVGEHFKNLILSLNHQYDEYSLSIANGMFIQSGRNVSDYYMSHLKLFFDASVGFLKFDTEGVKSVEQINQWISLHTNGKIRKLISEPLDPTTVMVLLNAIYFKGYWAHPFPKMSTWNSFFYLRNGTSKIVPFMLQQENFYYYKDPKTNCSFLELNYAGNNISMLLVLPKKSDEFPNFNLTLQTFCSIRSKLKLTNVMVVLPKFKMEYGRELSKDMIDLGMSKLFSDQADLTGIRENNDLHVSLMIHKALIVVDETGSEAAAVTGVGIDGRMKTVQQAAFWADHPFLFYIIHKESNTILFSGRVANP